MGRHAAFAEPLRAGVIARDPAIAATAGVPSRGSPRRSPKAFDDEGEADHAPSASVLVDIVGVVSRLRRVRGRPGDELGREPWPDGRLGWRVGDTGPRLG